MGKRRDDTASGPRRVPFGAQNVRALKAPKHGAWIWWDSTADTRDAPRGLGVRVTAAGVRSWVVKYRVRGSGVTRVVRLGRVGEMGLKEARDKASEYRNAAHTRKDKYADDLLAEQEAEQKRQREEEQRKLRGDTVAELIEKYLADPEVCALRSYPEIARLLRNEVVPHLGALKPNDVTRRDVRTLVEGIADGTIRPRKRGRGKRVRELRPSGYVANRVLGVLKAMYGWAVRTDRLERAPGWPEPPAEERERARVLNADEIRAVWAACTAQEDAASIVGSALKLMLLTGQRRGEVLRMRWTDIEEEPTGWWWTLPEAFTKNKRAHRVPLTQTARDVIERAREIADFHRLKTRAEWVLPGDGRPSSKGHLVTPSHGWERVKEEAAKLLKDEPEALARFTTDPPHMHDLRRTAATRMAEAEVPPLHLAAVLNHTSPALTGAPRVTGIYNRYQYDREKRVALEAWERSLKGILEGRPQADVVPITAARA